MPTTAPDVPGGAVAGPGTVPYAAKNVADGTDAGGSGPTGAAAAAPAAAAAAAAAAAGLAGGRTPSGGLGSARVPEALSLEGVRAHGLAGRYLPSELWLRIFGYLDARTLALCCATVSHYWSSLALEAIKDREYAQHETFMLTHSRVNVGAGRFCRDMDALLAADDTPVVITADSGGGKSSMLTQWILKYHQRRANALVLYHFVGSPAHSTDYMNVLHRFMTDIKTYCHLAEDVPSTSTNLQKKFPEVNPSTC
jgi:hypothetical protein